MSDPSHDLKAVLEFYQRGELEKAEALAKKLARKHPGSSELYNLLGAVYDAQGRPGKAAQNFRRAITIRPDYGDAYYNLGLARFRQDRVEEGVAAFRKALAIAPGNVDACLKLGLGLRELGRLEDAAAVYEKVLSLRPDCVEALIDLGGVWSEQGKFIEAVDCYNNALEIQPDLAEVHFGLGRALAALDRTEDAVRSFGKAVFLKSDYPEAHNVLGNALRRLGRIDEAVASYRMALAAKPEFAPAHLNLGNTYLSLGDADGAVAHFRKALAIEPYFADAHRRLSTATKHAAGDPHIEEMKSIYMQRSTGADLKMNLGFALGKAMEDTENYAEAFQYLAEANRLRRAGFDYNLEKDVVQFERLKEAFSQEIFQKYRGRGHKDNTPIFVVGMPRSGTTLVEQILASHSDVYGAGELNDLTKIVSHKFFQGTADSLSAKPHDFPLSGFEEIGEAYIQAIAGRAGSAARITDKMPSNFLWIGFIKLALPNARIIHCVRDSRDTCLSIYKTYFSANGLEFAYDLIELAGYHNLYADLMRHWRKMMPGHIYDISYSALIQNQEDETRNLLAACALPWEDGCLRFHETNRFIATASASQVRQPIYRSSDKSWKNYEKYLTPLLETLED